MHQVLLGIVKTLLNSLCRQMTVDDRKRVSDELGLFKFPSEDFSRQLRPLERLPYWKSSECKNFLLYGFIFLRNRVSERHFIHFFNLSLTIRILLDPTCDKAIDVAQKLIENFRANLSDLYGEHSQAEFPEKNSMTNR